MNDTIRGLLAYFLNNPSNRNNKKNRPAKSHPLTTSTTNQINSIKTAIPPHTFAIVISLSPTESLSIEYHTKMVIPRIITTSNIIAISIVNQIECL